jgi:hypothetical protein
LFTAIAEGCSSSTFTGMREIGIHIYIYIYIYIYSSLTAVARKKTIAIVKIKTLMIALVVRGGFKLGSVGLATVGATCMIR